MGTEPPAEPGCCYGNPDIAYSKRWMEQCKTFGTELECLMLTNDDGEPRCYFEPLGEYEDCERSGKCEFREGADADCEFVPTTTTSEPWLGAKDEAVLFGELEQGAVLS